LVIERLSDPEHAAQVTAYTTKRAERLAQVRSDIAAVEELAEALSDRLGRMEMTLTAFDKANKPLSARLAELTAERTSLESGELGPVTVATRDEITEQWDADDPVGRRTMLTRALGRWSVVIDPPRKSGPVFDRERVRLVPPET
jgi:septal ring factor EnvC (AmiA/AmiB activator)